jgi:hypothetical protein
MSEDFCSGWVDQAQAEMQAQQQQQQQQLQYSRSLSSKSPVTKEHILQIIVKGLKGSKEESCSVEAPGEPLFRSEVSTPMSVSQMTSHEDVAQVTSHEDVDSDLEGSESSTHKKFGLIRYRSLRDHNGRYYLVVKIR